MRTIEIRTTQNVTIEYELADLKDRFFGLFIDLLIVGSASTLIATIISALIFDFMYDSTFALQFIWGFLPLIIFLLYQLFSEIFADGQSFGKKAMGIKVVRLDGKEPNLSDYLLRTAFYLIDLVFSGGIFGALLISSSDKRQRLGDMTANTAVIKVKFSLRFRLDDILKINTLDDYEPSYPEVRKLSEQDMLLVKNIISRHRRYRNKAHQEVVTDLVANLCEQLDIVNPPRDKIGFLKTLIRDYIVLTR